MTRTAHTRTGNRGFALMFALGIIVVFAGLGVAYVNYMGISFDKTKNHVHQRQAQSVAEAGIHAAIAEL